MIVSTINVNGIRAAVRERSPENRGLLHWLSRTEADAVCLQETRADDGQLAEARRPPWPTAGIWPRRARNTKGRCGSRC